MKHLRQCLWAAALVAGIAMTGCKEDDATVEPVVEAPELEVIGAESGYAFAYYDGEDKAKTFTVYATAPWTIQKDGGWFVCEPASGRAGEETRVTLTVVENDGAARTGNVTVVANAGTFKHPVTTEYAFSLTQTAYHSTEFVVNGVEQNAIAFPAKETEIFTFTVENAYDWTMTAENETWYTVTPKAGKAGEVVTVTVTPKDNDTDKANEGKLTFSAKDVDNPANASELVITLSQEGYFTVDQHEVGYVFYNEDFSWIKDVFPATGSLYGYPTVDTAEFIDGIKLGTSGSNDVGVASLTDESVVAAKLAGADTAYGRYEGFIKVGKTAQMGYIITPAFDAIDEGCTATLLCSFRVQGYRTANVSFNPDQENPTIPVEILGAGTFDDGSTLREFDAKAFFTWLQHEFVVLGATAETQIKLGSTEAKKNRLFIDDIKAVRADDNEAKAAAAQEVNPALVIEVSGMPEEAMPIGGGNITTTRIHINREWKLTSDSDWLTFDTFACNTTKNGTAGMAYNTEKTEATSNGAALPFNNNIIKVAANDGAPRAATISLEVEGKVVGSFTVQQNGSANQPFITPSAKTINFNAYQTGAFKVTVDANEDWNMTQDGDWFTVSATEGKADATTEFTVTPKIHGAGDFAARSGKLTLTGATVTTEIAVAQAAADLTPTLAAGSDVYWSFSADAYKANLYNYAFEVDNLLNAASGTAYMQYIEGEGKQDPDGKFTRMIGGTGHPYVTGAWPGDYWLITCPTTALAAGTKVNFKALSRTSGTGMLYWVMEYFNGAAWVPTSELKTAEIDGTTVEYNLEVKSSNITIDETVALPVAVPAGFNMQFRIRCVANWQANGSGALAAPNGGTMRFAGAGDADSPRIKIVE